MYLDDTKSEDAVAARGNGVRERAKDASVDVARLEHSLRLDCGSDVQALEASSVLGA